MADVSIDGSVSTSTARGMRGVAFSTALIGYWFYIDSDGAFKYSKTTDGGATWGAAVAFTVHTATTQVAFDIWADWWTPGDTGTIIYFALFDTAADTVKGGYLDTSTDSQGGGYNIFVGASAVAGRGAFVSLTKTRSNYWYCAYDIDAGAERGFHKSNQLDFSTWNASLSATFVEATIDQCLLFPASGTGDNDDCWAIYQDASTTELTMKMWDSSAVAQVESSSMQTMAHNVTDLTGQMGFSGALFNNGDLFVVSCSERDTATADIQCWRVSAVNAGNQTGITAKTNITTNIDDIYHPAVCINRNTDEIYVAVNGKSDGSEVLGTTTKIYYFKSTDGGTTWGAQAAYQEGAAAAAFQVWAPIAGPRFYAGWRVGTTLVGNSVNSVLTPIRNPPPPMPYPPLLAQ